MGYSDQVGAPRRRSLQGGRLWALLVPIVMLLLLVAFVLRLICRRRYRLAGSEEAMSPEDLASVFPDRPIRPLPKRRLRERLSPDVADSIQYPPAPPSTTPLFYYPYAEKDEEEPGRPNVVNRLRGAHSLDGSAVSRRAEVGDDGVTRPSNATGRAGRPPSKQDQPRHQSSPSTASSPDGYEAFEHTNNKKKRKIPTAGDISLSGSHSLGDLSSGSLTASSSPSNGTGEGHIARLPS